MSCSCPCDCPSRCVIRADPVGAAIRSRSWSTSSIRPAARRSDLLPTPGNRKGIQPSRSAARSSPYPSGPEQAVGGDENVAGLGGVLTLAVQQVRQCNPAPSMTVLRSAPSIRNSSDATAYAPSCISTSRTLRHRRHKLHPLRRHRRMEDPAIPRTRAGQNIRRHHPSNLNQVDRSLTTDIPSP
jgi:hypothetical protein